MNDARSILDDILGRHADADQWIGGGFEKIKRLSNSKVGEIGQEPIERLCKNLGKCAGFHDEFPQNIHGRRTRINSWDIKIDGTTLEIKTATEDVRGTFQFNHIRYHRDYDALACIGISPDDIYLGLWSKADISTNKAGTLVSMDKGSSATFKLTKRKHHLLPIDRFEESVRDLLNLA